MGKFSILFLASLLFLGCMSQQGTRNSENGTITTDIKESDIVADTTSAAKDEIGEKIQQELKDGGAAESENKFESKQEVKTITYSSAEGDAIIDRGAWFFSIYNPQTGISEYYSSNGQFLGKKQKQTT